VSFTVDFINPSKILVNERYIDEPSIFNSSLKNKETIQQLSALAIDGNKKVSRLRDRQGFNGGVICPGEKARWNRPLVELSTALEIAAENIGYRARIDRKVNEAIWAKLETRSMAVMSAQRSAFKYATRIGVSAD